MPGHIAPQEDSFALTMSADLPDSALDTGGPMTGKGASGALVSISPSQTGFLGSAQFELREASKQAQELKLEVDLLRGKLQRRNGLLEQLVKAYYRDVVTIKQELDKKASMGEKGLYSMGTEAQDHVPSLDLRVYLKLFAPSETYMRVKPCDSCGGSLEFIHHESARLEAMAKRCEELEEKDKTSQQLINDYKAEAARDRLTLQDEVERFTVDREVFEQRVVDMKAQLARFDPKETRQLKHDIVRLKTENKEQSIQLKRMAELDDSLRKLQLEHEALQKVVTEKEARCRGLESDKRAVQEFADSMSRKSEELEMEVQRVVAAGEQKQREYQSMTEQYGQLEQENAKLLKAAADTKKTDKALRARLTELEKEVYENHRKNTELNSAVVDYQKKLIDKMKECESLKDTTRRNLSSTRRSRAQEEPQTDMPDTTASTPPSVPPSPLNDTTTALHVTEAGQEQQIVGVQSEMSSPLPVHSSPEPTPRSFLPEPGSTVAAPTAASTEGEPVLDDMPAVVQSVSVAWQPTPPQYVARPTSSFDDYFPPSGGASDRFEEPPDRAGNAPTISEHIQYRDLLERALLRVTSERFFKLEADDPYLYAQDDASVDTLSGLSRLPSDFVDLIRDLLDRHANQQLIFGSSDREEQLRSMVKENETLAALLVSTRRELEQVLKGGGSESLSRVDHAMRTDLRSAALGALEALPSMSSEESLSPSEGTRLQNPLGDTAFVPGGSAFDSVDQEEKAQTEGQELWGQQTSPAVVEEQQQQQLLAELVDQRHDLREQKVEQSRSEQPNNQAMRPQQQQPPSQQQQQQPSLPPPDKQMRMTRVLSPSQQQQQQQQQRRSQTTSRPQPPREQQQQQQPDDNRRPPEPEEQHFVPLATQLLPAHQPDALDMRQTHSTLTGTLATESVDKLREKIMKLDRAAAEARVRFQDRIQALEDEVAETRLKVSDEQERRAAALRDLDGVRSDFKKLKEKLAGEEARVASLREGVREKIKEVSDLIRDKGQLEAEMNFKLQRKVEELESRDEELKAWTVKCEAARQGLGAVLAAACNACKDLNNNMDRRVSVLKLTGVEKTVKDPGGRAMARRFDKKEAFEAEELLKILDAAKELHMPVNYVVVRLGWTCDNAVNDTNNLKAERKSLLKQIEDGQRLVAKTEKKVSDVTRAMEQQAASYEDKLADKADEIAGLNKVIVDLRKQIETMTKDMERLREIEAQCNELTVNSSGAVAAMEDMESQKHQVEAQFNNLRAARELMEKKYREARQALTEKESLLTTTTIELQQTKGQLQEKIVKLEHAEEAVKAEETRREESKSVSTQFSPELTEKALQTEFIARDMDLRHSLALGSTHAGRILVERVVTPAVAVSTKRRCTTALNGGVRVLTSNVMNGPEDSCTHMNEYCAMSHTGSGMRRKTDGQPMGSLKNDMQRFMKKFLHVDARTAVTVSLPALRRTLPDHHQDGSRY